MAIEKILKYTNRTYNYQTDDDTFIARGLHLNEINDKLSMVIDEVNSGSISVGNQYEIPVSNATSDGFNYSTDLMFDGNDLTIGNVELRGTGSNPWIQYTGTYAFRMLMGQGSTNMVLATYANTTFSGPYSDLSLGGTSLDLTLFNGTQSNSFIISYSNMRVQDNINGKGLEYSGNYDAVGILDDDWIPSYRAVKAYADSVGGGSYTFDSGLTEAGGNVDLGGSLTSNATLDHGSSYSITIQGTGSGSNESSRSQFRNYSIQFTSYAADNYAITGGYAVLSVGSESGAPVSVLHYDNTGVNRKGIIADSNAFTVHDAVDSVGMVYAADYSGSATARWIPDWGAVTTQIGGQTVNALITSPTVTQDGYAITWDNTAGEYTLTVMTGGTSYWSQSGTELSPATSGDDILLAAGSAERILFGNTGATTAIHAPDTDQIDIDISGTQRGRFDNNGLAITGRITADGVSCSFTGLGSDDTEDHVVAIDDVTGLLTKRSVASLGGGGTVTSVSSTTTDQLTVATPTTTPALTIVTGAVVNAGTALATGDQIYDFVIGQGYSTTVGTVTSVSGTGTVDGLTLSGTVTSSGNLTLSGNVDVTNVTGVLPVSQGGTGLATVGVNYVLTGNGTAALTAEPNMTFSGSTLAVTGAITATGEITAYASDERLKMNVRAITDPIEKVKKLNGVTYDWDPIMCDKVGFEPARNRETGFIAQNLQSVIEDAVALAPFDRDYFGNSKSGEEFLTTIPEKAIPLLVEAVKALINKVEILEGKK